MPQADSDPEALHARVEQWKKEHPYGSPETCTSFHCALIRDLAAEYTRLRERLDAIQAPHIGGDGQPVASCLLCEMSGPLAVWYAGTRAGVCESCRATKARVEAAEAEVVRLQAQLHAAEATIMELRDGVKADAS